jgi:hypothetical protein
MLRLNNGIVTETFASSETKRPFTRVLVAKKYMQIVQLIDYSTILECTAEFQQLIEITGYFAALQIILPENESFAMDYSQV